MKFKLVTALLAVGITALANSWSGDNINYDVSSSKPTETKVVSSLDGAWKVTPLTKSSVLPTVSKAEKSDNWKPEVSSDNWKDIEVPHNSWHKLFPDTYPDPKKKYKMYHYNGHPTYVQGWFSKTFTVPSSLKGSRIFLNFGAVSWESHIWVNGQNAGSNKGSFTGFKLDITKLVKFDQPNTIRMWVYNDFGENPPRHTYGKMFFPASNPGGITGSVTLEALPPVSVDRCLINPDLKGKSVDLELTVNNIGSAVKCDAVAVLKEGLYPKFTEIKEFPLGNCNLKRGSSKLSLKFSGDQLKLWTSDKPYLYETYIILKSKSTGKVVCCYRDRFGYRSFHAKGDKFFLNGERVRIYCGNILTAGSWERFASDNKKSRDDMRRQKHQGANAIRYHMAGADSHRMLAMADEEGMLVISEFPMFHRVFNDLVFKSQVARKEFMDNVLYEWKARLYRDYNHPSCVIWSLTNEVWTDSTVDELNEIYTAMKPLDKQNRPMSADSGIHSFGIPTIRVKTDFWDAHLYDLVSKIPYTYAQVDFIRYFKDLKNIYGKLDRPAAAFECLHLGFGKPSKKIPFDKKINVDEYIKLSRKNKYIDLSFMGLRHFLAWKNNGMFILNSIAKKALEQFRQETRIQGFHPWWNKRNIIFGDYPIVTSPVFVGAVLFPPNQFAGRRMEFDGVVIKDSLKAMDTDVTLRVVSGAQTLSENTVAVKLPENQDKTLFKAAIDIPQSVLTGNYKLEMEVTKDGRKISHNYYDLNIVNPKDIPAVSASKEKVAIFEPDSSALKDLIGKSVKYTSIDSPGKLSGYTRLIIHATTKAGWNKVISAGGLIRQWVKQGGRLLITEVPFSASLEWIMQGYKVSKNSKEFDNVSLLMEPVLREHPLFKGLSVNNFMTLNGANGVVGDALIYPFERNILAAGITCSRQNPVAGLVYESNIDKGGCMVSQVRALERYNIDSSATVYLHNLINYFLGSKVNNDVKPLAVKEESGFRSFLRSISGKDCSVIDLRKVVNRGLKDEKPDDGKGGWTDKGVNDFRHAPVGEQAYMNIPFEIIQPESNNDRSVIILKGKKCPDFPEKKTVRVNERCRRLFFLHAAWYLNAGKKLFEYVVNYTDGTKAVIPIIGGKDVGDWYAPSDLKNAIAVWRGTHPVVRAPFGFYLMSWDNPYPAKEVRDITIQSMGWSVPIILGISREKYVEYSESVLNAPWNFTSGNDVGKAVALKGIVQQTGACKFTMTRGHGWLALNQHDKIIDAKKWKHLSFALKASDPLKIKVLYFAPNGENGTSARLKPERTENGWNFYNINLEETAWKHGTSPAAKQWGGHDHQVSLFAIDLYTPRKSGTKVELCPVRLFKD